MAAHSRIEIIERYLEKPKESFCTNSDQDGFSMFFFSLLGDLFIQGYRVFENISTYTIILSLMQYTFISPASSQNPTGSLPQYKIINFEKDVILDKNRRAEIFKSLLETAQCIDGTVEINIIYLKCQKMSVMNKNELEQSRQPDSRSFFRPAEFLPEKRGYKHIDVKAQGTRLHGAIEFYLKGSGSIPNLGAFKRDITGNEQQIKFQYDLNKVINTLKMIVGKEIFANDYWIMSAEKWMRKKSKKNFKRFDLILRNETKICIIDWKFSKNKADEKINKKSFVKKNRLYFELAKNDYKAEVELKFYCIHLETVNDHYHKWTEASYDYKIDEITLDNEEIDQGADDSSQEIVFYDDKETQQKMIEQANFFEPRNTQENSQKCIQKFKQKYDIVEEKVKVLIMNGTKEEIPKVNFSGQKEKSKSQQKVFSDDEYNPGKSFESKNKENEEVTRGKRSKPLEFIQPEGERHSILDLRRKKVKLNSNINMEDVISISSKGQRFEEDDEIQILPGELDSMELKENKKTLRKQFSFDLKEIDQSAQHRYLTLIERPRSYSVIQKTIAREILKPDLCSADQTFYLSSDHYKTKPIESKVENRQNMPSNCNLNQNPQLSFEIPLKNILIQDKPIRTSQENQELLKCFQDEEEQKINNEPAQKTPQNTVPPQFQRKSQNDEIIEENQNKNVCVTSNLCSQTNILDEKNQLNTEALRRSYLKEQNERKKKNCNPRNYVVVLDSDEQLVF